MNSKRVQAFYEECAEQGNSNIDNNTMKAKMAFAYLRGRKSSLSADEYYLLGKFYFDGFGVDKNDSMAMECFNTAATRGNYHALLDMFTYHFNGGPLKIRTADKVMRDVLRRHEDDAEVLFALGMLYDNSEWANDIYKRNEKKAFLYFKKSSEMGSPNAPAMTAYCYRFAVGVESDTTRWRYWVDESVKKQPTMDICKCWTGYFLQEQERYKAAADWFESAAGHQFHDSCTWSTAVAWYFCGMCCANTEDANYEKAAQCFIKAAEGGYFDGMYEYGCALLYGRGVEKDEINGIRELEKAADKGSAGAMIKLAECCREGIGTDKNEIAAFDYYKRAADLNILEGIQGVAECYEKGIGVDRNSEKAAQYTSMLKPQTAESGTALAARKVDDESPKSSTDVPADNADLFAELDGVIGLANVKQQIRGMYDWLAFQKEREQKGLENNSTQTLHMVFTGNPGTGKTTVARIISRMFYSLGIFPSYKEPVEVSRPDLVGQYVGHTEEKTTQVINSALGGVLFIDEAYSLARNESGVDYGQDAINVLVKMMEDHRDNLIVILAGYKKEMKDFFEANSGLKSRFPIVIDFEDYSVEELLAIADKQCTSSGFVLDDGAREKLASLFATAKQCDDFGNGRYVRNVLEQAKRNLSSRIRKGPSNHTKKMLTTITAADIEGERSAEEPQGITKAETGDASEKAAEPETTTASEAAEEPETVPDSEAAEELEIAIASETVKDPETVPDSEAAEEPEATIASETVKDPGMVKTPEPEEAAGNENSDELIFGIERNGIRANGRPVPDGFMILAGSKVFEGEGAASFKKYKGVAAQREECLAGGIIKKNTLQKDVVLPSASAAAVFVCGSSVSGPLNWIAADGRTLKQVMNEEKR